MSGAQTPSPHRRRHPASSVQCSLIVGRSKHKVTAPCIRMYRCGKQSSAQTFGAHNRHLLLHRSVATICSFALLARSIGGGILRQRHSLGGLQELIKQCCTGAQNPYEPGGTTRLQRRVGGQRQMQLVHSGCGFLLHGSLSRMILRQAYREQAGLNIQILGSSANR